MNGILTDEVLTALTGLILLGIGAVSLALRKWMQDLKKQMVPNGGASMYDQTAKAVELSRKALEMSVLVEAQVRELKTRFDAVILASVPKG